MLSGEIRKWLCNKNFITVLIVVMIAQMISFMQGIPEQADKVCDYRGYREFSEKITEQNREEIMESLEEIMAPENLYQADSIQAEYTDSIEEEEALYRIVLAELKQAEGYPSYLDGVINSGNTLVSVFGQSDYAAKDHQLTAQIYSSLQETEMKYGGNYGCYLFSRMGLDDIICLVLFLLINVSIVTIERENMTILLLRGMAKGHRRISIVKYLWGLIVSLLIVAFYYGLKLIWLSGTYGLGNLSVPVQGIYGMKGAYLPISAGQYLLFFVLFKLLACAMIYSLLFFVAAFFSTSVQVYGVSLAVFALEYVLYALIEKTSPFLFLHDYNVFSFWNVGGLFGSYHNTNFFGNPIPYPALWMIVLGISLVFFTWFGIRRHSNFRLLECSRAGRKRKMRERSRFLLSGILFQGEIKKCWFCEKGYYLLVLSLLFTSLFSVSVKEDISSDEKAYYKEYIKEAEGRYSQKKMEHLLAEKQRLEEVAEKMSQPGITEDALQIFQNDLKRLQGLEPAISYGKYLKEHSGLSFVYASGYLQMLNGEDGKWNRVLRNLVAAFLMVGLSISVWGIEKWSGMEQLIQISRKGRKRVLYRKIGMIFLNGIFVLLAVYIPGLIQLFREYGSKCIMAPAQSIQKYELIPKQFSILTVIVLFYGLHLAVIWGIGFVSGVIQKKFGSQIISTIVSVLFCGAFVLLFSV